MFIIIIIIIINEKIDRWQLFTLWTRRQLDVELSCVDRYKRAFIGITAVHSFVT